MADYSHHEPGGFIPQRTLPSPAPSSPSSRGLSALPHPRSQALRPGSNKEDLLRRYAEQQVRTISRRFVKKFSGPLGDDDDAVGYNHFGELCKDYDSLINVLWRAGTPSLQIPYYLDLGGEFTKYMAAFPAAPHATFSVLRKLDHCFASLLKGQDVDTLESLPGFEQGLRAGMTTTDMVRCRSIVEETRVVVVRVMSAPERAVEDLSVYEADHGLATETETDAGTVDGRSEWDDDDEDDDDDEEEFDMDVARVYERTLVQLGERLGNVFGASGGGDLEPRMETDD